MLNGTSITISVDKKEVSVDIGAILYVQMKRNVAEIHVTGGEVYKTRIPLTDLEEMLGDYFIKVDRGCLVCAKAIYDVKKTIDLINGESLRYVVRKKKEVKAQLLRMQRSMIKELHADNTPASLEEYHDYYRSFDDMPFAFADIEMVWGEENDAVDWVFCYGNRALAELEKVPLDKLLGSTFGGLFANMDPKWLSSYERAILYGETLEIIDYSPEIDTNLNIICFPTFRGHCGCILFDITKLKFAHEKTDTQRAMSLYFEKLLLNRPD